MFAKLKNFKNLDLIFNSVSDMIFLISIDEDGFFRYVTANEVAIDLLQLPKGFSGQKIEDIMPPKSAEVILTKYKSALETNDVITYEEQIEFPQTDEVATKRKGWLESKVTPVFDDDDECEFLIVVTSEITERKHREQELHQLKEQFELIYNHAADPVFTFDAEGDFITVNPSFTKVFGWSTDELINNKMRSILPSNNKSDFAEILHRLKKGEVIENHYAERLTRSGETIHILSSYTPIMENGKMKKGIAVYKDITHLGQLRDQLRESESKYRIIVENSNDLIRVINKQGQIEYASPSHQKFLGLDPNFFIGKSYLSFVHREDMAKLHKFVENMFTSEKEVDEIEYRRLNKNREIIWVHTKGGVVLNANREVDQLILVSREISDMKERETELRTMALYDQLTGLPNRTLFNENVDVAMKLTNRSGKLTALLLLDCDNFKRINDTYGHDVGDEVIKTFANRVQKNVRAMDTVSRMGGDEFQVILPDLQDKSDATEICQHIVEAMKEPIEVGDTRLSVTASIGISYYTGKDKTQEELVKEADQALYKSKERGKSTFTEYTSVENKKKINILGRIFKKE
ncbi:diguanylate cyclase [Aquibacillus koreensis]|uniref:Diguanylate cyclase n=1 Tax=Aquibacillus koreensis TaxID=279446 RepID=A0A9X3WLN0_9BACI|nr:diguanylate cyclase [Aquibacillus koreensis]MCT2535161.1 diguanylate cyclase [Aquibacillus koreensis]MDC3421020.1 diguanylate cyclase [Aquibacillus koreensis]